MSKQQNKRGLNKNQKINGGFLALPRLTLRCEDWKNLSTNAKIVYITILTEWKREDKSNPEQLVTITHNQIEEYSGCSHSSIVRAMRELKSKGFLSVKDHGGLEKRPNTFSLNGRYLW